MPLGLLNEWVRGHCEATGRSFRAMNEAPGVLLDAGAASLIAIEWEADAHTLHVYGHPGHAARTGPVRSDARDAADDEGDDDEPGAEEDYAASIDVSTDDTERRTLHVEPDTGLVTLSLVVPFASLGVPAFDTLIDDFIADMQLWSAVFAGEAQVSGIDAASLDSAREGGDRMPWGAIAG
jgi:hypothetical protein